MKLQTARQGKKEIPQEFADRCRGLAQKIIVEIDDPVAQRIHRENAERMFLSIFVVGLSGFPGRHVRYSAPGSMQQALSLVLLVQEAEKQEKFNESFYTSFENSVRLVSRSPDQAYRDDGRPRRSADSYTARHVRSQHGRAPHSSGKPTNSNTRNARTKAALKCYECEGMGHFARECPTRQRRKENLFDSPGRGNTRERSRRSRSPDRPPSAANREDKKGTINRQGN